MSVRERLRQLTLKVYVDAQQTLLGGHSPNSDSGGRWLRPSSPQAERLGRMYALTVPLLIVVLWLCGFRVWQALAGGVLMAFTASWVHLAIWNVLRYARRRRVHRRH